MDPDIERRRFLNMFPAAPTAGSRSNEGGHAEAAAMYQLQGNQEMAAVRANYCEGNRPRQSSWQSYNSYTDQQELKGNVDQARLMQDPQWMEALLRLDMHTALLGISTIKLNQEARMFMHTMAVVLVWVFFNQGGFQTKAITSWGQVMLAIGRSSQRSSQQRPSSHS